MSTAQVLVTGPTSRQEELIIDCGATHHMFNSESFFSSINKTPPMKVSTGDSESSLRAKGVGTVTISCNNHFITLSNCLFVPNLNCNLISLLELFKGKLTINCINDQFTLESNNDITISGKIQNNLMKIEYQIPKSFATRFLDNRWHLRVGHPSNQVIKSMGLPHSDSPCKSCDLNKMCHLPFDNQFEHKSEAYDQFIIVKRMMENLHDRSIKKLVSDRGGEFLNEKFKKLSEEQGFIHFFSPPETPQHNGFAERANQTILEKAWCMLSTSNLPNCYWAEAVNTATLLSNFTPMPSRMNNCPFSLWKKTGPRIKKTRIFGCRAIVSIPKSHREWKLGPSGSEGIMLGYENEGSCYRVLRLNDHKILISRHVKFDESTFPSLPSSRNNDILSWGNFDAVPVVVDEIHPGREVLVDEIQASQQNLAGDSNVVDEVHSPVGERSDQEAPSLENRPRVSRIKVIGPRHPTIITGDITNQNILPYSCRANALITVSDDSPQTFKKAITSQNKEVWIKAIEKELSSMNSMGVWEVIDLKPEYRLVGTTWVFCSKKSHLNEIIEHKARLCAQGFTQTPGVDYGKTYSPTEPCVFFRGGSKPVWLYIHGDDIAIFGPEVGAFKEEITKEFQIKDVGNADLLLGVKISHSAEAVVLDQGHYAESIIELYGMSDCKPVSTPLVPGEHLHPATPEELEKFKELGGTQNTGLVYRRGNQEGLKAYSDADWGNCKETRRSISGYLTLLNGNLILWKTKKQPSVLISTGEAEYKAVCDLVSELLWLRQWGQECGLFTTLKPIPIHEDNQSCINSILGNSNLNNRRMKHVDIQLHFVK
ncbi:hypothetical protein O181_077725 [Austropuccinia psidii MF-1]|uniref:Integrase catalytic domain-containing protein n=1 Tax=Austropuccinia psidii MF-1 TaxID=1389203 RepID=A0A9Q3FIG2_9BASI|nr:hypothetical protein [Austropuccinia psidii MF-1]